MACPSTPTDLAESIGTLGPLNPDVAREVNAGQPCPPTDAARVAVIQTCQT
jgi:hypothetical protein